MAATALTLATTLEGAVAALAEAGAQGAALAGATWIMRAPLRAEPPPLALVAIGGIADLKTIDIGAEAIAIGACVTHARLAAALDGLPELHVLAEAAGRSANPAIRSMATVGGNLCTAAFPAADLVPALLCLDAAVELASPQGAERLPLPDFLARRTSLPPGTLLRRVVVQRAARRTAHARLPLRKAGDYPVAIVSVALTLDGDRIVTARVAVGAVEVVARRWERLEQDLVGRAPDPPDAATRAAAFATDFHGRDGIEAPGWYRTHVLPTLVRRAFQALRP